MGVDYSFELNSIETYAPNFLDVIIYAKCYLRAYLVLLTYAALEHSYPVLEHVCSVLFWTDDFRGP